MYSTTLMNGQRILVTGGGTGLGQAMSERLLSLGADVAICGRRKAITDSKPGSTRDRNYAQASWQGAAFELIDTGGLLLGSNDPLLGPAADQAALAIAESDRVILVVDGRAGSHRGIRNDLAMLTQLGILPPPQRPGQMGAHPAQ